MLRKGVVLLFWLLCLAPTASAQGAKGSASRQPACDLSNLTADCQKQLDDWQKREHLWREWTASHGSNRRASGIVWHQFHPRRPTPPGWVAVACGPFDPGIEHPTGYDIGQQAIDPVCAFYFDVQSYVWWDHYKGFEPPLQTVNKSKSTEYDDFWSWLNRAMHYDIGWVPAHSGDSTFLIAGAHLDLAQINDRVSLFGPGIMAVNVKERDGKRSMRVAETWGLSFRLKDFRFPGVSRQYSLYFNFAKARISGGSQPQQNLYDASQNVMGFSISMKK